MVNEEPNLPLKGVYCSKEACRYLGISKNTLRSRRLAGLIRDTGVRPHQYTGAEIRRFWCTERGINQ